MLPDRDRPLGARWFVLALMAALPLFVTAVARPRLVSNDSFGYLDVAMNVGAGRGLVQSVTGWNAARFPATALSPAPFTAQAPLYPLMAGAVIRAGLAPIPALLLLAMLAQMALWWMGAALARELWGEAAAVTVLTLLAASALLPAVTTRAWSEALAIALALATMTAQARELAQAKGPGLARLALAGALAGLAYDARFAFAISLPVALGVQLAHRPRRVRAALALSSGWLIAAGPVLVRQRVLTGSWRGVERNPSSEDTLAILRGTIERLGHSSSLRAAWIGVVVLAIVVLLAPGVRARAWQTLREAWRPRARLPLLWALTYLVAIVALRSRVHFDAVGFRLLAPAAVMMAVSLAGAPWAGRRLSRPLVLTCSALLLAIAMLGTVRFARSRALPDELRVAGSPLMSWLREHAAGERFVIAEDAADLAYYLREGGVPRALASFSANPYMRPLDERDLEAFARAHDVGERGVLLVVRGRAATDADWRRLLGPMIADAVAGRLAAHPALTTVAAPGDGWVFRYRLR